MQNKYPWQQEGLENLPGEFWDEIPGHDGYYFISNLGRIKRASFEILCKNGTTRHYSPRLLTPQIERHNNHSIGDTNFFLRSKIMRSGISYSYSVPRLLYYLFIKKFDLEDHSIVVCARDGNGKNVQLKNLKLVDLSGKQRGKKNQRAKGYLWKFA